MPKVSIRYQQVKDARRFFDILSNPHFIYFSLKVESLAKEKEYLKSTNFDRKNNIEWRYTVLYGDMVVGGIGLKINRFRKYIGELGYFIDEKYWGKGIATRAVKLIDTEGFKKIGLKRIEILMRPENKASEKVAVKAGYKKEALMRKAIKDREGKLYDAWLYAKTL